MIPDTDAHLVPVNVGTVQALTRPDPQLWTLYIIYALMSTVAFPAVILPLYFKYRTLRYRFDDEGVSVSFGLIWRRETYLTYARIQDIHVTRNIFERWLGLGTVKIQTASGNAAATESVTGIRAYEDVRNFLYAHMRGHLGAEHTADGAGDQRLDAPLRVGDDAMTAAALVGIRDELRAVRQLLEQVPLPVASQPAASRPAASPPVAHPDGSHDV